jgi:integrase
MPLSNAAVQAAQPADKAYRLTDTNGLYLEVRPSGAKLWRYRYRIARKENKFTLGKFFPDKNHVGHLSLEGARRARDEARALVRKGIHPFHDRQQAIIRQVTENKTTFKAVADEWIERKEKNWSKVYAAQIRHVLKTDVYTAIGSRPIASITASDILQILFKVERRGANTFAHLIRQWVSAIFRYAIVTQRAQTDPAAPLRGAIVRNKVRHSKALSREELTAFLKRLENYKGDPATIFGFRIMLLTFVRTIELRAARWTEFNIEKAEWRIPAARMKMREEHIVPLSRQVMTLLEGLHDISGHSQFLFPNRRNPQAYMTSTTLNRALERMKFLGEDTIGFAAHGFRATASTMLNEGGFNSDVIERQLAHQDRNKVRASYNHASYLDERKIMMQVWADMVDEMQNPKTKVLAFMGTLSHKPG